MQLTQPVWKSLLITDVPRLDPINVLIQDREPGKGLLVIQCAGIAWSNWWGAMGTATVARFAAGVDADYLSGRINKEGGRPRTKAEETYLLCIVKAVQAGLREALAKGMLT